MSGAKRLFRCFKKRFIYQAEKFLDYNWNTYVNQEFIYAINSSKKQ